VVGVIKFSNLMRNCTNCTNCYDCNNCDSCTDCRSCANCKNCKGCMYCDGCSRCTDCKDEIGGIDTVSCYLNIRDGDVNAISRGSGRGIIYIYNG
jgi:hypothetical protein